MAYQINQVCYETHQSIFKLLTYYVLTSLFHRVNTPGQDQNRRVTDLM